jgi:hypothetical protein
MHHSIIDSVLAKFPVGAEVLLGYTARPSGDDSCDGCRFFQDGGCSQTRCVKFTRGSRTPDALFALPLAA